MRSRILGFQASIAEFLLLIRLRSRQKKMPRQQETSILENANQVMLVTCKHWFLDPDKKEDPESGTRNPPPV